MKHAHRSLTSLASAALIAALSASALATTTQDTIMATTGGISVAPNNLLLEDFGVSLNVSGNPTFAPGALLALTVVDDHPYRMIGANIPVALSLALQGPTGARFEATGIRLISAEAGSGYDYTLTDAQTGTRLFEVNGGSFRYDPDGQTLDISQAWLRTTDELAARIDAPRAAGNLIASIDLTADTVVVRREPFLGSSVDGTMPGDENHGGLRAGGDVVYQTVTDVGHYGPVGTTHAYIFGTGTCNMGNQNISWLSNGTPGVAFNMYRLHGGRLMQIGLGFVKTACCAAAGNGCGLNCNGQGGSVLGAGCLDTYGSSWNAQQNRLMPRSQINAYTGSFGVIPAGSGSAVWRRCQVEAAEMAPATHPGALYFAEGVYVGTEDSVAGNRNNNASYRRVTLDASFGATVQGTTITQVPAIAAWRANGLGVGVPDTRVNDVVVDVPGEGRFHAAYKVTDNQNGTWTYDYAVFNLSSDRSGGSLEVPVAANTAITNIGFHDIDTHSNEPYDNTDWVVDPVAGSVRWHSPQTFVQNPNSNALRWGMMYNYWFTANRAPAPGNVTLGLFKTGAVGSVSFVAAVPAGAGAVTPGDIDEDGDVDINDLAVLLSNFGCVQSPETPVCTGNLDGDTDTDLDDLSILLAHFGQ